MIIQPPSYLQGVATPPQYSAEDDRHYLTTMNVIPDSAVHTRARGGLLPGPDDLRAPVINIVNMDVTVGPYRAIVPGTIVTNQGDYRVVSTSNETVTIGAASATLNRIDLIGLLVEDEFYAGTENQATLHVEVGAETSGTPSPPAEPDNFLPLYEAHVDAGVTSPTLTERRTTASLIGGVYVPFSWEYGDDGTYPGELRMRVIGGGSVPNLLERWDGAAWVALTDDPTADTPVKPFRSLYNDSGFGVVSGTTVKVTSWRNQSDDTEAHISQDGSEITYSGGTLTVARPGAYLVSISLGWSIGSSTQGRFTSRITAAGEQTRQNSIHKTSSVPEFVVPHTSCVLWRDDVENTVDLESFQDSGVTQNLVTGATGSSMNHASIAYLGNYT